jgi:CRISPR-associated protein Cas6
MTSRSSSDELAVDAVFPLAGRTLPRDHAEALQQALCAQWPWLQTDGQAGIHSIRLVSGLDEPALLSRRACLLLRVGARRLEALMARAGIELAVAGHALSLGLPRPRELRPHGTLYACKVAAESADEIAFMAAVERELADLNIGGQRVCGRHQQLRLGGRVLNTFSLMLHALAPEQSLRLQCAGIGPYRLLGCGLFVPHKSAAAV